MSNLLTTTDDEMMEPIHPGEVLKYDFLDEFGITQHHLAVAIGVPPRRINEIVLGKRAISPNTALRLGRYFGNGAQFWLALQADYDLCCEMASCAESVSQIKPLVA